MEITVKKNKIKNHPKIIYTHTLPFFTGKIHEHLTIDKVLSVLLLSEKRSHVCASNKTRKLIYKELLKRKISWRTEVISSTYDSHGIFKIYNDSNSSVCAMVIKWIQSGRISEEKMLENVYVSPPGECDDDNFKIVYKIAEELIHKIYKTKHYYIIKGLLEQLAFFCYNYYKNNTDSNEIDWHRFVRYGWLIDCGLFTFTKKITIIGTVMQYKIRKMIKANDIVFNWI